MRTPITPALFFAAPRGRTPTLAMTALAAAVALSGPAVTVAADQAAPAAVLERVQFADVIERARPAVVKIAVKKRIGGIEQLAAGGNAFGGDERFGGFFRRFSPGPFAFGPQAAPDAEVAGLGSGFVVDETGYIVTNNHVIEDAEEVVVTLADGKTFPAKLVGRDTHTDLALLKIEADAPLPAIAFGDSDRTRVGDWVVAIGSPFGLGGSVTAGIISARGRDIHSGPYDDYLQIDAPINSGNSGGPIVDANGKVVGVNTAIFSPNGGNVGIGFAIPAREAQRVVGELREHGSITRGWLGVQIQPVTAEIAQALKLSEPAGALVADVVRESPAARAGISAGDVIMRFDGVGIREPRDLSRTVARAGPGSKVAVEVLRDGKRRVLSTTIDRNADEVAAAAPTKGARARADNALGLMLEPLLPDVRARLGLDEHDRGALVARVAGGSPADVGGLRPGDVLIRVNQANIDSLDDAVAALAAAVGNDHAIAVLVRRGQAQFFTSMKPV